MTIFTQHFILSQQQSLNGSHQCTTLTCQVRINFTFESSFKQITRTNTDTQCNHSIPCFTCCILEDSKRRIQPTTFEEHSTKRRTRPLGSYKNYIYISRRNNTCAFFVSNTETVREVKCFTRSQIFLHSRPYFDLSCIREQVLNNGSTLACFVNIKQCLARYPTVSNCFFPGFATFTLSYDYIKPIVTQI